MIVPVLMPVFMIVLMVMVMTVAVPRTRPVAGLRAAGLVVTVRLILRMAVTVVIGVLMAVVPGIQ